MERVTYETKSPKPEHSSPQYSEPAEAWLEITDSTLHIAYSHTGKYLDDDVEDRDIYKITLKRGRLSYAFTFGQSVAQSARWVFKNGMRVHYKNTPHTPADWGNFKTNPDRCQPDAYSILSCVEKHNPGTFEEFCGDFGYDTDSRKAEKTYRAVVEQYLSLERMYSTEELVKLAAIE